MFLIFPIPLNMSLYWSVISLIPGLRSLSYSTLLMPGGSSWILRSLIMAKEPSSLICNIPTLWRIILLMRSGELILPLVTTNLATAPQVWFFIVAVNSPFTGSSLCKVLSFSLLGCSVSFTLDRVVSALNWCSSMEFTSAPLSGSALTSTFSIFTDTVLSSPSVLIFFTCFRCLTAWQKNSSSELAELSASSSSVVLFTRRLCFEFSGGLWSRFLLPFLLLGGPLDLHRELKWLNFWHLIHFFPYAGQFLPSSGVSVLSIHRVAFSVCSFWLCGSIVAYPIIYRLVPSPSRFEIRQCQTQSDNVAL